MPIQSWGKSGILAYFRVKIGYFAHVGVSSGELYSQLA